MKNIKRTIFCLAALLVVSGLAMAAPVSARDGTGDTTSTTTSSNDPVETTPTGDSNTLTEQFKEQARQKIEAEKHDAKQHTEAEREKSCTARQNSLNKRMSHAVEQAKKHKAVFDKIYTRVKDFHDTKKLDVPNYAALTAAVDTAGSNAQTSIDALQSLDISVDCTSQTVANSVSAFQQAVKATRDSLKTYRSAITDLIKAVKGASTSSENSSTNTTTQ
jgi:hypothetical protein